MKNFYFLCLLLFVHLVNQAGLVYGSLRNSKETNNVYTTSVQQSQSQELANDLLEVDLNLHADRTIVIAFEDGNEDEDFIKKHVALKRFIAVLSHIYFSSSPFGLTAERHPFVSTYVSASSCKYLEHGVLRI